MSRGGKRIGAGRPRKLDDIQSLVLGKACEDEWTKIQAEVEKAEIQDLLGDELVRGFRALRNARDNAMTAAMLEQLQTAVRRQVSELREMPRMERGTIHRHRQVKGSLKFIRRLAKQHGVSKSLVYQCWNDYREMIARVPERPITAIV